MIETFIHTIPSLRYEAEKRLADLPCNIVVGDRLFFEQDTNIFINDTAIDSFSFITKLLPPCMPNVQLAGEPPRRYIEIWDTNYLTKRLAETLVANSDLSSRVIIPMSGCGELAAISLARCLSDCYGITLEIKSLEFTGNKPSIIVDDVLKTGATIVRELPNEIIEKPDTIYAVWAISTLTKSDFCTDPRYQSLRLISKHRQEIFAGVVYGGAGLASPGLGLPVNSLSTLMKKDQKSIEVIASLADKYFGQSICRAVNNLS